MKSKVIEVTFVVLVALLWVGGVCYEHIQNHKSELQARTPVAAFDAVRHANTKVHEAEENFVQFVIALDENVGEDGDPLPEEKSHLDHDFEASVRSRLVEGEWLLENREEFLASLDRYIESCEQAREKMVRLADQAQQYIDEHKGDEVFESHYTLYQRDVLEYAKAFDAKAEQLRQRKQNANEDFEFLTKAVVFLRRALEFVSIRPEDTADGKRVEEYLARFSDFTDKFRVIMDNFRSLASEPVPEDVV